MEEKGFTLLEILIVFFIFGFLTSLTLPLGLEFHRSQELNSTTREIIQTLRETQVKSMSVEDDSSFGFYRKSETPGEYVLFRGESYAAREEEEVFDINDNIFFEGVQEVTFSKLNGIPSTTGDITLNLGGKTKTININALGRVTLKP